MEAETAAEPVEQSGLQRLPSKRRADGTLLGVAPPQSPAAPVSRRNPVIVHSGTISNEPASTTNRAATPLNEDELEIPSAVSFEPAPAAMLAVPLAVAVPTPPPLPKRLPGAEALPKPLPEGEVPLIGTEKRSEDRGEAQPPHELKVLVAPSAAPLQTSTQAIRLSRALQLRVRWLGIELALGVWLLPLVTALLTLLAISVALSWHRGATPSLAGSRDASVAPAAPAPVGASPPPAFDRAAAEAKPSEARSVAEVLQLAGIAAESKREGAQRFEHMLKEDPTAIRKKATLAQLRKLVEDPLTAQQALGSVASLPGPVGPDLLYESWAGSPSRNDATELARGLIATREVRAKASEALSIALDLRAAETCAVTTELLSRARQVADRRALSPLTKWKSKRQCTANASKDCCTADQKKDLDATIRALKLRRAPSPFEGT